MIKFKTVVLCLRLNHSKALKFAKRCHEEYLIDEFVDEEPSEKTCQNFRPPPPTYLIYAPYRLTLTTSS